MDSMGNGINIGEPPKVKCSELPPDEQEQIRKFFEDHGWPCPPLDFLEMHCGPW